MAYERTWQPMAVQGPTVSTSASYASARHIWDLAQMLLGRTGTATSGTWTISYSCDGTTAGTLDDGVDRWGTPFTTGTIPNSQAGTGAHGWMVLKRDWTVNAVNFTVYLLLSCRGYGASAGSRSVVSAGLGVPSGGTTTADPTMSIIVFSPGSQQNIAPDNSADVTNPRRYYGSVSTTGDFWFIETILGEVTQGEFFFQPVGTKTNDQCPFFGNSSIGYTAGGGHPFGTNYVFARGAITAVGTSLTTYYNGAASGSSCIDPPPTFALLDASDVSIFDKPAFVTTGNSSAPTAIHSRGRLPDTGLNAGVLTGTPSAIRAVNIGTTIKDPQTLDIMYATINAMILPYNTSIS